MSKIKNSEVVNRKSFIGHIILSSLNSKAIDTVRDIKDRDENTEYDVRFTFNGIELDFRKVCEFLDRNWDDCLNQIAKKEVDERFEKYKNEYNSKNCKTAKMEKIRIQLQKVTNQLKMVQDSISNL